MGIVGSYSHEAARRCRTRIEGASPVIFDSWCGPRGRFPLAPAHPYATLKIGRGPGPFQLCVNKVDFTSASISRHRRSRLDIGCISWFTTLLQRSNGSPLVLLPH